MNRTLPFLIILLFISCNTEPNIAEPSALAAEKELTEEKFIFSTWVHADKEFDADTWRTRLNFYDSLGISEVLVAYAGPEMLGKIVKVADEKNMKIHAWMWTLNRPEDSIANKHPEWYAVNRLGQNSLEHRAYVNHYQWLSPFHPEAREHVKNNVRKFCNVEGLASVHLDYVRFPDVFLGENLQKKYDLVQDHQMPKYDYGYHPIARRGFKEIFGVDPVEMKNPEVSPEWLQFRLNAVTSLVNECAEIAHQSGNKITAAVFPFPERARQMVRQAWNNWNLDMVYPMLYQSFYAQNINWIGFANEQCVSDVEFPVNGGLYMKGLRDTEDLEKAIRLVKEKGGRGAAIFMADHLNREQQEVVVKLSKEFNPETTE